MKMGDTVEIKYFILVDEKLHTVKTSQEEAEEEVRALTIAPYQAGTAGPKILVICGSSSEPELVTQVRFKGLGPPAASSSDVVARVLNGGDRRALGIRYSLEKKLEIIKLPTSWDQWTRQRSSTTSRRSPSLTGKSLPKSRR
jgi:hypothetical protein